MEHTNSGHSAPAQLAGTGYTQPEAPQPGSGEFTIAISAESTATASIDLRSNAQVIALLAPFEDGLLCSATVTLMQGPSGDGFSGVYFNRSGGGHAAADWSRAIYRSGGFHARYDGKQHMLVLPPVHHYGRSLKATNLGNPSPQINVYTAGTAPWMLSIVLVVRPSGVYVN